MMSISFNSIYIELTTKCILHCPYCYHGFANGNNREIFLPLDRYRLLMDELPKETTIDLSGGEPLLHPDIKAMIYMAFKKGHHVRLVTNGILLNNLSDDDLSYLESIAISLDGTTPEEHDEIRGKESFNKMESCLKRLYSIGLSDRILFNVTVSKRNINNIELFMQYAQKWNVGTIKFENLHLIPNEKNHFVEHEMLSVSESVALYEETKKLANKYKDRIIVLPSRKIGGDCPLVIPGSLWGLRIDAKMNVFPCEGFCGTDYSLGNISDSSLSSVLTGNECNTVVNYLKNRIHNINKCQNCCMKEIFCHGGCAADAYFDNYDCLCTDGACSVRLLDYYRILCK